MSIGSLAHFSERDICDLCDKLVSIDPDFEVILQTNGYPELLIRPNTFESLVHFILEQQVSVASANAALEKLRAIVGSITPDSVMRLSDQELKLAYFSRQKITYVRSLAGMILAGELNLRRLRISSDEDVRRELTRVKGIGNWTVDVYLITVLHRTNVFPIGDVAAINALKYIKHLPHHTPTEDIKKIIDTYQPYKSIALLLLWHFYVHNRQLFRTKA